jgi:hypothetical protein
MTVPSQCLEIQVHLPDNKLTVKEHECHLKVKITVILRWLMNYIFPRFHFVVERLARIEGRQSRNRPFQS